MTLVAFTIIGGNACIAVIEPLLPLIVEKGPYNLGTFETGLVRSMSVVLTCMKPSDIYMNRRNSKSVLMIVLTSCFS